MDYVAGPVPREDLGDALFDVEGAAVRPCRHVAVGQRSESGLRRVVDRELGRELTSESAFLSLDDSAGVMRHECPQQTATEAGVAQISGSVERVEAGAR